MLTAAQKREYARLRDCDDIDPIADSKPFMTMAPHPEGRDICGWLFEYEILDLDDLVASHDRTGAINKAYPDKGLQWRDRSSAAYQDQIRNMATSLDPNKLMRETSDITIGSPIVGPDSNAVESGNGRTIALKFAAASFPTAYERYEDALRRRFAPLYGLDIPKGIKRPVLVRRRVSNANPSEFVRLANQSGVSQEADVEAAFRRAASIDDSTLKLLSELPDATLQTLNTDAAADLRLAFIATLPESEKTRFVRDQRGNLTEDGREVLRRALLARVYGPSVARALSRVTGESELKVIANASYLSLPGMARAVLAGGEDAETLEDFGRALDRILEVDATYDSVRYPEGAKPSRALYNKLMFDSHQGGFFKEMGGNADMIAAAYAKLAQQSAPAVAAWIDGYTENISLQPAGGMAMGFAGFDELKLSPQARLLASLERAKDARIAELREGGKTEKQVERAVKRFDEAAEDIRAIGTRARPAMADDPVPTGPAVVEVEAIDEETPEERDARIAREQMQAMSSSMFGTPEPEPEPEPAEPKPKLSDYGLDAPRPRPTDPSYVNPLERDPRLIDEVLDRINNTGQLADAIDQTDGVTMLDWNLLADSARNKRVLKGRIAKAVQAFHKGMAERRHVERKGKPKHKREKPKEEPIVFGTRIALGNEFATNQTPPLLELPKPAPTKKRKKKKAAAKPVMRRKQRPKQRAFAVFDSLTDRQRAADTRQTAQRVVRGRKGLAEWRKRQAHLDFDGVDTADAPKRRRRNRKVVA